MVVMETTLSTQSWNCQRLDNNDPKWIARRQFQEIVMSFFKEQQWHTSMVLLWPNKELFWTSTKGHGKSFFGKSKWFPTIYQALKFWKVLDATVNLLQWFEVHYPQKNKVHWIIEVVDLWDKVSWWAKFTKTFSMKLKLAPWIKALKTFLPKLEVMVFCGFQAWEMCSFCPGNN